MSVTRRFDWLLLASIAPIVILGLLTMKNMGGSDYFFNRQLIWVGIGFIVMCFVSLIDWRRLKSSAVILTLYSISTLILGFVTVAGYTTRGASSWLYFGGFAVEPVEITKLALILVLAKYFSGRYVEIALWRHIFISFIYLIIPVLFIIAQPDFGSASILVFIWGSMIVFSGLKFRQVVSLFLIIIIVSAVGWTFVLKSYQKTRIITFLNPEQSPQTSGYHAIQAMIAVGSGGLFGKGVGYGTQSRLHFLPESQTDFMFAAFAEEWGLVGVGILFIFFGLLFWRILLISTHSPDNFSKLVGLGFSFLLLGHIAVHIGMNLGLLPITGISLPFMSYGGSFLIVLMGGLGILQSIASRSTAIKAYHEDAIILTP